MEGWGQVIDARVIFEYRRSAVCMERAAGDDQDVLAGQLRRHADVQRMRARKLAARVGRAVR